MKTIITKRKNGSVRVQTILEGPSKTDPSFKNDCDVNKIMARFMKTGQVSHLAKGVPAYHDVSEVPDLDVALNHVAKAQEAFDALPAETRRRFGNSPVEMTKFLFDPKNAEEAHRMGLISETTLKNLAPPSTLAGENAVRQKSTSTSQSHSKKSTSKASNDDESNDDE